MKKKIIFLLILTASLTINAQVNKLGYPFYSYFNTKDLNVEDQNWSVIQGNDHLIYIANNGGVVLQYDGQSWRRIFITKKAVRALAKSENGLIYVGGENEFGFLHPEKDGSLGYKSLMYTLDSSQHKFMIYNVFAIDSNVYFSGNRLLLCYNYFKDTTKLINLPPNTFLSFPAKKNVYGASYSMGLFSLEHDSVKFVKNAGFFNHKNIFSIIDDSSKCYLVTGQSGVFENRYDGEFHDILKPESSRVLKGSIIYSACKKGGEITLGTLYGENGIVTISSDGELKNLFDQQVGIKDHLVTAVNYYQNSLWATLNIGISQIEIKDPIRYFGEESKLEGYVNDILFDDGTLYVGTDLGVYYLVTNKIEKPEFKKIEGVEGQVYSLVNFKTPEGKSLLIAGSTLGLFQINSKSTKAFNIESELRDKEKIFKNKGAEELKKSRFYVNKLLGDTDGIWVSDRSYLFKILYVKGKWYVTDYIFDVASFLYDLIKDDQNNIWFSIIDHGIFKVDLNSENRKVEEIIGPKVGLPNIRNMRVTKLNNNILALSDSGMFKYNPVIKRFETSDLFPEKFNDRTYQFYKIHQISSDSIVVNYNHFDSTKIDLFTLENGQFHIANKDFNRLGNSTLSCYAKDKNAIWFGISNKLYSYNLHTNFNPDINYKCLVRKVEGIDTTYFNGTFFKETPKGMLPSEVQNEIQKPVLLYSQNDITFHFAAPFYEGSEAIKYSFLLEGFKSEWSKWNKESKAVFTNLNEGHYIFHVKAKNIYDNESEEGTYEFTILPPWYRTIIAYFLYVVLAIFAVWIIVKLYTRRLKQDKIRLEGIVRERTAEIRLQRDEIAEQKQSIEDSILYASRIQKAILPSKELADELLPEHFILFRPRDIVSGDYYWMNKIDDKTIIVAADCTGHGVPGAFMSMLGVSFLNEIVLKEHVIEANKILNNLRERVKHTLKQEGKEGEAKDGMDVALVVIDEQAKKLYFSGAYNPVLIYRGTELTEIKADRMPIGIYIREKESFTLNEFDYQPGDTFYIFSDGYPDQFGGEKGQKFRIKAMKELLEEIQSKTLTEQKEILNTTIEEWMGDEHEQIDDMVIIGVRL